MLNTLPSTNPPHALPQPTVQGQLNIQFRYEEATGSGEIENFPGGKRPRILVDRRLLPLPADYDIYLSFKNPHYLPITYLSADFILHVRPDKFFHEFFGGKTSSILKLQGHSGDLDYNTNFWSKLVVSYLSPETREIIRIVLLVIGALHKEDKSIDRLGEDCFVMYGGVICVHKFRFVGMDKANDYRLVAEFIKNHLIHPETTTDPHPVELKKLIAALENYDDSVESVLVDHLALLSPSRKISFFTEAQNRGQRLSRTQLVAYNNACYIWQNRRTQGRTRSWLSGFEPYNRKNHFYTVLSTMAFKANSNTSYSPYSPFPYNGYKRDDLLRCTRNSGIHFFDDLPYSIWNGQDFTFDFVVDPVESLIHKDVMMTHSFGKEMMTFQLALAKLDATLLPALIDGIQE